jgi:hypothetical protein
MISLLRRAPAGNPAVDPLLFREAMSRPEVARELFLPVELAWWDAGRFTLGRFGRSAPRPSLCGVRLQEPRPSSPGPPPERDTQNDLCALVGSVAELRRIPELAALVLSDEVLVGRQAGAIPGKRVQFGLRCSPNGRFQAEVPAAAECHRVMRRALKRAGFAVEYPKRPFNSASGFGGLREWASEVRLRRQRGGRVWLLLLFLLPFLFLIRIPGTASSPPVAGTGATSEMDSLMKQFGKGSDYEKLLKELGGSTADLPGLPPGTGGAAASLDRSLALGIRLSEAGTVAYLVGGAWLLWVAESVGIGAVIGMLLIPGYAIVPARTNWSRTWLPFVIHMGGMVLIGVGIYYLVMPIVQLFRAALP